MKPTQLTIDFYVSSTGPEGELVTNVGIKIVSETEAIVCDCGDNPKTVRIGGAL